MMNCLKFIPFIVLVLCTEGHEVKLEYYDTVSFDCNENDHNFTNTQTVVKSYWLIPDGNLISDTTDDNHYEINANFTLTVHRISDGDFGYYFCLLVRSDHTVDRIVHGLNVDGPYFGDLLEKYKKNAMIGGIAAGSIFVVVSGLCLVSQLRYQKRRHRNKAVDELDKAIDGYDLKAYTNIGVEGDDEGAQETPNKQEMAEKVDNN